MADEISDLMDYAEGYARTYAHGTVHARHIARKLLRDELQRFISKSRDNTLPATEHPTESRSTVFRYIDDQVRKEMAGFYDAFNLPQPPI